MESQLAMLYPTFVLVRHWQMPESFNDRLHQIASTVNERTRVRDTTDPRNIGDPGYHGSHKRHNFFAEPETAPEMAQLLRMADTCLREFLRRAYAVAYEGEFALQGDTFAAFTARGEREGIATHTHQRSDLVCTYYPRVRVGSDVVHPLHRGAFRVFDSSGRGKRSWRNASPAFHTGGWAQFEVREGTMIVVEGNCLHDSSFFDGEERMCIAMLVDLLNERAHRKAPMQDLIRYQLAGTIHG